MPLLPGRRAHPRRPPLRLQPGSTLALALILLVAAVAPCRRLPARSRLSFDQIRAQVAGRSETDIERLLGTPDVRQPVLVTDERWIWWNFTFLDGPEYAPELRGQPVHLEITFACPAEPGPPRSHAAWRALGPLAVTYSKPSPAG